MRHGTGLWCLTCHGCQPHVHHCRRVANPALLRTVILWLLCCGFIMHAYPESSEPAARRRAAALFAHPLVVVLVAGVIVCLIAWFVTDRHSLLQQRALTRVAVLNARVAVVNAIEDDLVSHVGDYLSAESSVLDAYEDWVDEQELRATIDAADKVIAGWAAHEETLALQLRTRIGQDDVQTAFESLLTALDTLTDEVDRLRPFADESSSEQEDAIDRCREEVNDVEDALADVTHAIARSLGVLAGLTPPS